MFIKDFTEAPEAITINAELNPKLWADGKLIPAVRAQLLIIAKNFADFLKVEKLNLRDITVSGSNAGYNYSDSSDIDLHLVADIATPDLAQLYDAKKNQYNFTHNIRIHGIDVELYVQDSKQKHFSAGIYSVLNNQWLSEPKQIKDFPTHKEIKSKARNYASRINQALRSTDLRIAKDTMSNIRRLRQAGLEAGGEGSVENLAFKLLRARGQVDKLRRHIQRLQDAELSLPERTQ